MPRRLKAHWSKNDLEYLTLNLRTTRSKPTPSTFQTHTKKKKKKCLLQKNDLLNQFFCV